MAAGRAQDCTDVAMRSMVSVQQYMVPPSERYMSAGGVVVPHACHISRRRNSPERLSGKLVHGPWVETARRDPPALSQTPHETLRGGIGNFCLGPTRHTMCHRSSAGDEGELRTICDADRCQLLACNIHVNELFPRAVAWNSQSGPTAFALTPISHNMSGSFLHALGRSKKRQHTFSCFYLVHRVMTSAMHTVNMFGPLHKSASVVHRSLATRCRFTSTRTVNLGSISEHTCPSQHEFE